MEYTTPDQAWDGLVGSQTPAQFMQSSREMGLTTVEDACAAYAQTIPAMFDGWSAENPEVDLNEIAGLLARYIRTSEPNA